MFRLYDDQLIVITGAAGFIGSNLVRHLNELGMKNLLLVDHLGHSTKWKNLIGRQFVDLLDKAELLNWLKGRESLVEAFVHLGACSDTTETHASYLLENNYRYSVHLAEYAIQNGHRFIYASSAATYGDGSRGFSDDEASIFNLQPLNMYGFSKQLFDQWVIQSNVLDKVVGLKYFNIFGPNEAHKGKMASAICRMVPQILNEGKVKLFKSNDPARFADGEQKRDFLYVKDCVRMTAAFLTNEACGIYNIGSGQASTWNELARATFKAVQKPVEIEYIPMPEELKGKYQNFSQADLAKTKKILGKEAKAIDLEDAISDYVRNYLLKNSFDS